MIFDLLKKPNLGSAIINEGVSKISYSNLLRDVNQFALSMGCERRKFVVIKALNNYTTVVAYLACLKSNHPVLLIPCDNSDLLERIISDYSPNLIVDCSTSIQQIFVHNESVIRFHASLCLLVTTSGSTGSPKLVKLSKRNLLSNTRAIIRYLGVRQDDVGISGLKFSYSYGLSVLNAHLLSGASMVLTESPPIDDNFWHLVSHHKVTSFSGVPFNFQSLSNKGIELSNYPSLRYATQAGGKLSEQLVIKFATQIKSTGGQFFVMYGQTEASPRIAYLPPEHVWDSPNSIGIAIPNGKLQLRDLTTEKPSDAVTQGELIYKGPNIMMGYAFNQNDFTTRTVLPFLATGDLARKDNNGLYFIEGRLSRFVKPFGLRLNLDDIQKFVSDDSRICAVTGDDEQVIIAIEGEWAAQEVDLTRRLSQRYKLPKTLFNIIHLVTIPRLSNDKFDYQSIKEIPLKQQTKSRPSFVEIFINEIKQLIGFGKEWQNVFEIFIEYFPDEKVSAASSFTSLSGDSLSYVAVSSALEEYLNDLPEKWFSMTIEKLEQLKSNESSI